MEHEAHLSAIMALNTMMTFGIRNRILGAFKKHTRVFVRNVSHKSASSCRVLLRAHW